MAILGWADLRLNLSGLSSRWFQSRVAILGWADTAEEILGVGPEVFQSRVGGFDHVKVRSRFLSLKSRLLYLKSRKTGRY